MKITLPLLLLPLTLAAPTPNYQQSRSQSHVVARDTTTTSNPTAISSLFSALFSADPAHHSKVTSRGLDARSSISDLFASIGSLVKPIDAPGNKDVKRDVDVHVGVDALAGIGLGVEARSTISDLFQSIGSLVKPIDAPGNKDAKREVEVEAEVEADHAKVEAEAEVEVEHEKVEAEVEAGAQVDLKARSIGSTIGGWFQSLGDLVKPVKAPGNKVASS